MSRLIVLAEQGSLFRAKNKSNENIFRVLKKIPAGEYPAGNYFTDLLKYWKISRVYNC
jgi:hypothetical protein